MPKQQFAINKFEGGLVSDPNPRDIGENQFSVLKGFDIDSLGAIKLLGKFATHSFIAQNADTSMTFNPGYGLFSFSSDRSVAGTEQSTDYLAATNGDYIHIWDNAGGDTGSDAWNNMTDSIVDDTNGFSITEEASPNADANDHIWSFYAPDGNLRVSDGNFENYNHMAKILKFVSLRDTGVGDNTTYPTTYAQGSVGGDWIVQNASVEQGLTSNNLKMINLGSLAKGVLEGNSVDDSDNDSAADYIATNGVAGNVVTVTNANFDHGINDKATDYFNGMTCSLFKDGFATIYGVVTQYTYNSNVGNTESTFEIQTGPNGDVSPQTALAALTSPGADETWSFQVGQHDGYLWNNDLDKGARTRGVISADYGVTLAFSEHEGNTGSWMPTSGTRYKFYHTTTFDASSGDLKQQESAPSLFTMYLPKNAAGLETHDTTKEMYFSDNSTWSGLADNATASAGTSLAVNFALIVRLRSDNSPGSGNYTVGNSSYDTGVQDTSVSPGTYNFFGTNERVTGGRVYWSSSEDGFNSLNLLMDYDLEKGIRPVGSGSGQSTIGGYAPWQSWVYPVASNPVLVGAFTDNASTWYAPPILETYETINGYSHDAKMDAKWKTAVMANNRVYAANIKRKSSSVFDSESFTETTCVPQSGQASVTHTANKNIKVGIRVSGTGVPDGAYVKAVVSGTEFLLSSNATVGNDSTQYTYTFYGAGWSSTIKNDETFPDRIIKSPVGKYDIFPDSAGYVIEGFNSNDGDEIIKLETFADRLLVFKKYKLQIYNIQKGTEFLEQEVLYNGLDGGHQGQSCATDFGIAWMNSKGVYFYDGRQVQSLTDNSIRDLWVSGDGGYADVFWLSNSSDIPVITFDPDSKKLFCLKTCTAAGSDDETCLVYSFKTKSWTTIADGSSIDNNQIKRFGHYQGKLIMEGMNALGRSQIKSWNDASANGASGQQALTTKDFDFGAPGVRKKIYKVYITYQSGNSTTNVQVKYGINGDTTPTETFKDGDNFASNELAAANGWQVAELKPSTSIKDCKSFQLAITCDGAVPAAFEIDDITIIYRTKSIK